MVQWRNMLVILTSCTSALCNPLLMCCWNQVWTLCWGSFPSPAPQRPHQLGFSLEAAEMDSGRLQLEGVDWKDSGVAHTFTGGLENPVGSTAKTDASDYAAKLIWRVYRCCPAQGTVAQVTFCCSHPLMPPQLQSHGHCSAPRGRSPCPTSLGHLLFIPCLRRVCLSLGHGPEPAFAAGTAGKAPSLGFVSHKTPGRGFRCWATKKSEKSFHCSECVLGTYWSCIFSQKATLCLKLVILLICVHFFKHHRT